MKLATSLLLGSAAGLAVVSGAQAADLPVRKAAPVDYVRICSPIPGGGGSNLGAGTGFFYIPGTDTCLNVGGRVRAEYRYLSPITRGQDTSGFRARGLIALDARTATAYGTLRTFIRYELTRNTGNYVGQTAVFTNGFLSNITGGASADAVRLERAFIQFGGLTAGRTLSFFDAFGHLGFGGICTFGDSGCASQEPVVFAYTFTFGGGFSGTISVESPDVKRNGANQFGSGFFAGTQNTNIVYQGQEVPDIIGRLEYSGAWGQAWLTGAAHQIRANQTATVVNAFGSFPTTAQVATVDEWGFALQAAVKVNLPMLGAGDALYLAGTYTNGAVAYSGVGATGPQSASGPGVLSGAMVDGFVDVAGNFQATETYGGYGALMHYWAPQWRTLVYGGVTFVDYAESAFRPTPLFDHHMWNVGANLIWTPVRSLDIGVEVVYRKTDFERNVIPTSLGMLPVGVPAIRDLDAIEARVRVQRDF